MYGLLASFNGSVGFPCFRQCVCVCVTQSVMAKVHKHHIAMMVQSRKRVEQAGYKVVGGLLVRSLKPEPVTASSRLNCVTLVQVA